MKFDILPGLSPCMLSVYIDHLEVGAMHSTELRTWRVEDPVYFYQPDIFELQVLPLNPQEECIDDLPSLSRAHSHHQDLCRLKAILWLN